MRTYKVCVFYDHQGNKLWCAYADRDVFDVADMVSVTSVAIDLSDDQVSELLGCEQAIND